MNATNNLKVNIIGGGLGRLLPCTRVKKTGVKFNVFERDASPISRLQGYRLSMNPEGLMALHHNLPLELWNQIEASLTPQIKGIAFVSEQLEERFFKKTPDAIDNVRRHGSISRIRLREILLSGLEETVIFNKRFTHYKLLDNGRVRCFFSDGFSDDSDLIIGADGTKSKVRNQLYSEADRVETGVSAIAGQVILDDITRQDFLPAPLRESAVVVDKKPQGLFLASHQLDGQHNDSKNYVFWSFLTNRSNFPDDLEQKNPEGLIDLVDSMTAGWHPRLKRLITRADPKTVLVVSYKTSVHPKNRWQAGPVTLLGDAIHSMPPTSGEGANTALQDAEVLCTAVTNHSAKASIKEMLNGYETRMFEYAFKAVENAMNNLNRMVIRSKH